MKTLLAAALAALPLAVLAGDPAPVKPLEKAAVPEELHNQAETKVAPPKADEAKPAESKATPAKDEAKKAPAKAEAKPAAKDAKAAPKKDEKPCEPVKPCSID